MGIFSNHKVYRVQEQLNKLQSTYNSLEEKYCEYKHTITKLCEEKENLITKIKQLSEENICLKEQIGNLEQEKKNLKDDIEKLSVIKKEMECISESNTVECIEIDDNSYKQENCLRIINRDQLLERFVGIIDVYCTNRLIQYKYNLRHSVASEIEAYIEGLFKLEPTNRWIYNY